MKKWDYILIGFLLVLSITWLVIVIIGTDKGDKVVVKVNNYVVYEASLSENTDYMIKSGNDYNHLVIKDGEAYIDDANCKGLDCVRTGHISNDGDSIICIPHLLTVTIESDKDNGIDYISE